MCVCWQGKIKTKKVHISDFLGCPVVKTMGFQCKGCRFDSWSGNKDPTGYAAKKKKKKEK